LRETQYRAELLNWIWSSKRVQYSGEIGKKITPSSSFTPLLCMSK